MSEQSGQALTKYALTFGLLLSASVIGYSAYQLLVTNQAVVEHSKMVEPTMMQVPGEREGITNQQITQSIEMEKREQHQTVTPMPTEEPATALVDITLEPTYQLPILDESDSLVLKDMFAKAPAFSDGMLVDNDIIRRIVVLAENFSNGKIAKNHHLFNELDDDFTVSNSDMATISQASFARYDRYVNAIALIGSQGMIEIYRHYEPLFNEAYQEIGRPNKTLSSVILECIALIESTPEVPDNAPVMTQSVTYKYISKEYEALAPAQKQWLRMGAENRAKLQPVLYELKTYFTK